MAYNMIHVVKSYYITSIYIIECFRSIHLWKILSSTDMYRYLRKHWYQPPKGCYCPISWFFFNDVATPAKHFYNFCVHAFWLFLIDEWGKHSKYQYLWYCFLCRYLLMLALVWWDPSQARSTLAIGCQILSVCCQQIPCNLGGQPTPFHQEHPPDRPENMGINQNLLSVVVQYHFVNVFYKIWKKILLYISIQGTCFPDKIREELFSTYHYKVIRPMKFFSKGSHEHVTCQDWYQWVSFWLKVHRYISFQ